jgi:acyl-CoA thioester hydrolase
MVNACKPVRIGETSFDMNRPSEPQTSRSLLPSPEDFPHRVVENVRFSDIDANGHVNNAKFSTFYEAARVSLFRRREFGLMPEGKLLTLAQITIQFRAEIQWPGMVEIGLAVISFGRSSVVFEQALFTEGRCVSTAQAINVLIDETTRKSTPLTDEIKANFSQWLRA